jgi:hypothetical protein
MQRQRRTRFSNSKRAVATALRRASNSPQPLGSGALTFLSALLFLSLPLAARSEPGAAPASPLPNVSAPPPAMRVVSLESLTLLPTPRAVDVPDPSQTAAADRAIAAAADVGSDPSLEPLNPFRKRDFDLIRGERDVEIGGREMELRWRVRPKTKETISLELRF